MLKDPLEPPDHMRRGKGLLLWPLRFTAAASFLPRCHLFRHTRFFIIWQTYETFKKAQTPIFRREGRDPEKLVTCLESHGWLESGLEFRWPVPRPQHTTQLSTNGRRAKSPILLDFPSAVLAEKAEGVSRELKWSGWWFAGETQPPRPHFPLF